MGWICAEGRFGDDRFGFGDGFFGDLIAVSALHCHGSWRGGCSWYQLFFLFVSYARYVLPTLPGLDHAPEGMAAGSGSVKDDDDHEIVCIHPVDDE